ncbi:hypothetical protein N656DRAFT_712744 [Canariomyces notabilis]|uniref:Uncharacterized protein n=1 Tax=Canariomyces notabilis TaxID=2074819 RepID=A0AAN6QMW8_9PEZI|nr:hypothetical protein N656DRAFT_712744 [Canariomyces arenarius]
MSAPTAIHGGTAPLAALTSVFTPPCPTTWLLTTTRLLSQYPAFPRSGPQSCDPPSWSSYIAGAGFQFYSPAICPDGFIVGPSCGLTKTRTAEGFPAIAPGETAVYCIPAGLTCTTDTSDFRGGVWGFARDATTAGAAVTVGPAIQIRWVEADLTKLETHPLTPGLRLAKTEPGAFTTLAPLPTSSTSVRTSATTTGPDTKPTSETSQQRLEATSESTTPGPNESINLIFETGGPTTTLAPQNASNAAMEGGIGALDRGASIAVIVVVTVIAGVLLFTAAFLLIRRRRERQNRLRALAKEGGEAGLGPGAGGNQDWASYKATTLSPISELDGGSAPANAPIGSTPNPAELEGEPLENPPPKAWTQRSWLRSPSFNYHLNSPRSIRSSRATRHTYRESFGEKDNDPAAALGRLKIPNLATLSKTSSNSASPKAGSFWRLPLSPRSPVAGRLSAQLSKLSSR